MTRKKSSSNTSNGSNAANGRKRGRSGERQNERETEARGVAAAGTSLDLPRGERGNEDAPNEASELEKPGTLPRSQVIAIQNLRRKSWSIDKIHATTGVSKSTVHKYCRNITPTGEDDSDVEYRPNPKQVTLLQTLAKQGMSNEELQSFFKWPLEMIAEVTRGIEPRQTPAPLVPTSQPNGDSGYTPQMPKVPSEIFVAERPTIEDNPNDSNNGNRPRVENYRTRRESEPNGTSETQIIDDSNPRWRMAKALLVADALRFRVNDPVEYVSNYALPDIALARDWMPWVPGDTR